MTSGSAVPGQRPRRCRLRPGRATASLVLPAAALAAWEGTVERLSLPSRSSVGALIGVAVVGAAVAGRSRQRATTSGWARGALDAAVRAVAGRGTRPGRLAVAGLLGWTTLVLATIGWDLNSFVHQVQSLPTLSRLFGDVTREAWGRGLVFAAWLGLGAYLAAGWRRRGAARLPPAGRPEGPRRARTRA